MKLARFKVTRNLLQEMFKEGERRSLSFSGLPISAELIDLRIEQRTSDPRDDCLVLTFIDSSFEETEVDIPELYVQVTEIYGD